MLRALSTVVLLAVTACFGVACASANPNPNDIAWRYEQYTKLAGRSATPQPREVFAEPLKFETKTHLMPEVPESGIVDWRDAAKYLNGADITVEGKITDTFQIRDVLCRLNFVPHAEDDQAFYVALFSEAYEGLPAPPAEHFLGKTIRVTGQVTSHRGRPNIEVNDIGLVEIVAPQ